MKITFTRKGYFEVWHKAQKLSQHTQEREATESIINHAGEYGDGEYEIRGYRVVARVIGSVAEQQQGDIEPPTQPQNVSAVALSATEVQVTWDASTDDVGVETYQVYRDGAPLTLTSSGSPYTDTDLTPSTQYSYVVAASDLRGNQSDLSDPALVTTLPNAAPVWSGLGDQQFDENDGVGITLDSFCSDADGDTITYLLIGTLPPGLDLTGTRNESLIGTVITAGTYPFTLRASDGLDSSDLPLTFTVVAIDSTPPDPPAAPTLSAVSTNSVTLDLPASAAPDHAYFNVYRSDNDVNFGPVESNVTTLEWSDFSLNSNTTYYYRLTDVDTSDNESLQSASLPVTTEDFTGGLQPGPRTFEEPTATPTHYVSPNGTGTGATAGDPMSLVDANAIAGPGKVFSMRDGNYQTSINPVASGVDGDPCIYQKYPGETPILIDTYNAVPGASNRSGSAINISGKSYITVWGIDADGQNHPSTSMEPDGNNPQATGATIGSWVAAGDTHYCVIRHCAFIRANGYTAIRFDNGASYNIIEDCYAERVGSSWYSQNGELFEFRDGTHHNICRHNQFRYAGHGVLTVKGDYNVAEYNVIDNRRWDGPGFFDQVNGGGNRLGNLQHVTYGAPYTGGHLLYQYNRILGNWIGGPNNGYSGEDLRTDGINVNSNESIVRFNDVQGTYGFSIGSKIISNSPQATSNHIYNNNIADWNQGNSGTGWQNAIYMSTGSSVDSFLRLTDNVYRNNSITVPAAGSLEHIQWLIRDVTNKDARRDDEFDNNQIISNSFEAATPDVLSFDSGTQTLANLQTARPDIANSNVLGSVLDLTQGTDLAEITSASNTNQTVFRVDAAQPFFPGISALGMAGDEIRIGRAGSVATITAIDYATGDITVTPAVSWTQGDGVSLESMVSNGQIRTGFAYSTPPPVDLPPVWSGLTDQNLPADVYVAFDLDTYCTDPEADVINYSIASGSVPVGMSLVGARGQSLEGTPTSAEVAAFTLRASDGQNNSDLALTFTVTAADTTPPDAPAAPTLASVGQNQIILDLPVSAAPDHSHYEVWRATPDVGGTYGLVQDNWTQATYTNSGLSAGTAYHYYLRDVDTAGNRSAIGSVFSQATQIFTGGEDLEQVTTAYFVGAGGSDGGGDGRTHATRWATLANATGLPTSSKVYILAGTNLTSNSYSPNWNGTSGDYALIGAYYLDPGNGNQVTSVHEGTQANQSTLPILTCTSNFTSNRSHWVVRLNGRQYWTIQDVETKLTGFLNYFDAPHVLATGGSSNFILKRLRARAFATRVEWETYLFDKFNTGPNAPYGDAGGTRFEEYLRVEACNTFLVEDSDYLYSRGKNIFVADSATIGHFNRGTVMFQNGSSIRIATVGGASYKHLVENMTLGGSFSDDGSQIYNAGADPASQGKDIVYRNCVIKDNQENALDLKGSEGVLVEKCIVYSSVGRNSGYSQAPNRFSPGALMTGTGSIHAIHRFNLVYDNSSGIRNNAGRVSYQNTLISNSRDYTGPNSVLSLGANSQFNTGVTMGRGESYASNYPVISINNLVMNHRQYEAFSNDPPAGCWHDSNIYYNAAQTPGFYNADSNGTQAGITLAQYQDALAANPNTQIGAEAQSQVINPLLADIPDNPVGDYFDSGWNIELQGGSPAANAAIALATVTQNGSTNPIPVSNARLFFAGWTDGDGVEGDYVKIGADVTQITAVSRVDNTITVNPAISYTSGDEIYLCASDGTPHNNIGASQPSFTLFDPTLLDPPLAQPPPGSDPVWTTVDQTLQANAFYNISFDNYCTDPDGGSLTYTKVSGTEPLGMAFSGTRGEILSGTPTAEAVYTFTMRAADPDGRFSDLFITITTTFEDVTPPPAPDAPVITAYGSNHVLLTQPANPDPDHDNYRIQRSLTGLDNDWGTIKFGWRAADGDYVDSAVNASTTYYYRLISIDAVPSPNQNISDPGPSVSVTTQAFGEEYSVYLNGEIPEAGIFGNDTGITNAASTWSANVIDAKGGTFTFSDGGLFTYTAGTPRQTGEASFLYVIWDYDGAGSADTATVRITIQ